MFGLLKFQFLYSDRMVFLDQGPILSICMQYKNKVFDFINKLTILSFNLSLFKVNKEYFILKSQYNDK